MRLRDIIGLVIALLLAVGVALLTRVFLTHGEKPKQEAVLKQAPVTRVLVAGKTLSEGDKIRAGDLVWQSWPNQAMNINYIKEGKARVGDFMGAVVRFHIGQGEPVLIKDLVKPGERSILAAVITPGKRAISIDVTPSGVSSGLIAPGDYVDVVLSLNVSGDKQQHGKSQTILSNIKVIALDTDLSAPADKPKNAPHVATLEVTPGQAEVLMAGQKEGLLSLSLHSLQNVALATAPVEPEEALKAKKDNKIIIMRGKDTVTIDSGQ
jgi:pilus assembly protein CpaB